MKERTENTTHTIYTCEVCGTESPLPNNIRACERRHKRAACDHDVVYFEVVLESGYNEAYDINADKYCKKCDTLLESRTLTSRSISSEIAETLFNLMEKS